MDELKEAMRIKRKLEQESKERKEAEMKNRSTQESDQTQGAQKYYDKQVVTENLIAIILYIIVMVVGTVFNDRIYVYAGATVALICYLGRHSTRKGKKK